jgi:hypothetical protein
MSDIYDHPAISLAVRTLTAGGFLLESLEQHPGYVLLHMVRSDARGVTRRYCFVLAAEPLEDAQLAAARLTAEQHQAEFVWLGRQESEFPTVALWCRAACLDRE